MLRSENNFEVITLRKAKIADFAKERNNLMKKSRSEWIFFLDSDEKFSRGLNRELSSTFQVEQPRHPAYYVKRRNYFLGRHVGTDRIIRLVRKGSGRWTRRVH